LLTFAFIAVYKKKSVQASILSMKKHPYVWLILLFFGLVYADISFVNHYMFRTTAWDMGIFNNALYDYAHFKWNYAMVRVPMSPMAKNLLGDHFELYPILFSPLYYIFGTYTLLLLQIVSILWGGLGAYRFILHKTGNAFLSRTALIHFLSIWGIYTALVFDYHNNVVAAMGLPWFLYYFDINKFRKATLVFIFIVIGKENMPLWMGFVALALAVWHFRDKHKAIAGALYMLAGFAFFILVVKVIIPAFAPPGEGYAYNSYQVLGNNFGEVVENIFKRPWYTFTLLFRNHTGDPTGEGAKMMTHIAVLISGGWALLYRPKYLLMLLPVYGQKLFFDEPGRWGIYMHYSIEFVPLITTALFTTLPALIRNREKWLKASAIVSILLASCFTIHILKQRLDYHHEATHEFFNKVHYKRDFNVREAHRALNKFVPENVSVSAQSCLVPHLAFRDTIYQFPAGNWCDYIVLTGGKGPYEIPPNEFDSLRAAYASDPSREIIYDKNRMMIIRKKEL
jgi:uncharacterized membrane protein